MKLTFQVWLLFMWLAGITGAIVGMIRAHAAKAEVPASVPVLAFPQGPGPVDAWDTPLGGPADGVEEETTQYVLRVMDVCRPKLSEARRKILAEQVARVSTRSFADKIHRQAFVALLCIESNFAADAESKVKATGIAQLMPQFAAEFARECGLGKLGDQDIYDTETNLRLGACRFKALLRDFDGNVALALAGYNSGAASPTTRKLSGLGTGAEETSGYLAKHYVLTQAVKGEGP
jgi:hypothetical protein